ncbi:uncharacterized protein N7511_002766 [Penicillium nucicola]|uniref:uncharacterized protein n=1 Tax=Penicillium nucicola TaxID=1850975 RepID=UPI00254564C7|nr:uncharacterized protein N7511_002766 [Penicillium nucicola]KAJ5770715.1 hypothetical protein N7511_002766 [Penicillium nucicola]
MSTSIEGQPQIPARDNAGPEVAKQESISQNPSQPQIPAMDNASTGDAKHESFSQSSAQPQIPAMDNTSTGGAKHESFSQNTSQPQNIENKDHAVSSGKVENAENAGSSETAGNSENAEKTMDQGRRGTAAIMEDHHVSREALKGPTGDAKKTAAEFEKENKTGKPAGGSIAEEGDSSETKDHAKGDHDKGDGHKQSTMEKLKEKIAHPLHGKKSE